MSGAPLIDTGPVLIEREQECAVLDALVDRLGDRGGTVVVRGEAGIGKSVLLQRVRGRAEAQGARPLVTVGVESEAEVAFAGLHQLLRPVIGALAQQPESQRQVLEAALGLGVDHTPDPFRVAVAAFQLICDVADSYAEKFTGKYSHRVIRGGIGHNLPQEAPQAFADAIIEVDGY